MAAFVDKDGVVAVVHLVIYDYVSVQRRFLKKRETCLPVWFKVLKDRNRSS